LRGQKAFNPDIAYRVETLVDIMPSASRNSHISGLAQAASPWRAVLARARIGERIATRVSQAHRVIQLAIRQQPGIGGDCAAARLEHHATVRKLFTLETTKFQYTDGVSDTSRISPDNWTHDQPLLDRPGNNDIQLDIFYDYRTNLPLYPKVQEYLRKHQPPTLIVWGKNDFIFPAEGAHPYKRDLADLEFHLIDTGHFALEDKANEVFPLIKDFLNRKLRRD